MTEFSLKRAGGESGDLRAALKEFDRLLDTFSIERFVQKRAPRLNAGGNSVNDKPSQSPRDRILWVLAAHGGKMERSILWVATGMRYALLIPILEELVREGRIKMTAGKHGDLVSLIDR